MRFFQWIRKLFPGRARLTAVNALPSRNRFAAELVEIERHLRGGHREDAAAACRRLDALLKSRLAETSDADLLRDASAALQDLGSGYRELGIRAESQAAYDACRQLSRKLLERTPTDLELLGRVAACHNLTGLLLLDHNEPERAAEEFAQAVAIREQIQQSHPGDGLNRVYLAGAICNLGAAAAVESRFESALSRFEQAIELLDREIPGCECGCRDMTMNLIAQVSQQPMPVMVAHQFLWNAVQGRGDVLNRSGLGPRYRQIRCETQQECLIVSVLPSRLCGSSTATTEDLQTFRELRFDLVDVATVFPGAIVVDLRHVEQADAEVLTLLSHVEGRLVGSGRSLALSGVTGAMRSLENAAPRKFALSICDTVADAIAELTKKGS